METRVHKIMDQLSQINPFRGDETVPTVPKVQGLMPPKRLPMASQIASVQRNISALKYNFLPMTFFTLDKNRPLRNLLSTAQEILQESLPIRCLEATFLAVLLTAPLAEVERFPLAFKSTCAGKSYRHIVLVLRFKGMFGAVGLSRIPTLMDKPLGYPSLLDLLDGYAASYQAIGHELVSIKVGLYFTRDPLSRVVPFWRFISTPVPRISTLHGAVGPEGVIRFGRRKGNAVRTPVDDESAHPVDAGPATVEKPSFKRDVVFAMLIDKFCDMLPALSDEYNEGGGEAVNAAMEALKNVKAELKDLPNKLPPRGRPQERSDAPRTGVRSAVARLRSLPDAPAAVAAEPVGRASADDGEDDDDNGADSDSEENTFRINCVLQGASPFKKQMQTRAQSQRPAPRASSISSKLRAEVSAAR